MDTLFVVVLKNDKVYCVVDNVVRLYSFFDFHTCLVCASLTWRLPGLKQNGIWRIHVGCCTLACDGICLVEIYRCWVGTSRLNLTCKRAVFEPEDEDNIRKFLPEYTVPNCRTYSSKSLLYWLQIPRNRYCCYKYVLLVIYLVCLIVWYELHHLH